MTEKTQPTDAELDMLIDDVAGLDSSNEAFRKFARAVLAKWGTPPAVAGEPVASVHSDTLAMLQSGQCRPWDGGAKLHPPSKARFDTAYTYLYTTPQPTQAQAGAVPLTYQQVIAAWNAQADEHNQWGELCEDEKIEWAVACATNAARSQAKEGGS